MQTKAALEPSDGRHGASNDRGRMRRLQRRSGTMADRIRRQDQAPLYRLQQALWRLSARRAGAMRQGGDAANLVSTLRRFQELLGRGRV